MKIKVCGITSVEQLEQLQAMGVDYAGLIFYPKSARYAAKKLEKEKVKSISIRKVGVFVNEAIEAVKGKIKDYGLAAVQLHGDESADYCRTLMNEAEVVKVFRMKGGEDIGALTEPFQNACQYFLFDTDTKGYGGSGKQFDWEVLQQVRFPKPFFLSGGIGMEDIEKVQSFQNPFVHAVDVNSRFEVAPGVKDMQRVQQFVKAIKH